MNTTITTNATSSRGSEETKRAAGRLGQASLRERLGEEGYRAHMAEIGRRGGAENVARHGAERMAQIARLGAVETNARRAVRRQDARHAAAGGANTNGRRIA